MTWIVFSRNRTYQLDATLCSLVNNGSISQQDVIVLHRYDDSYKKDFSYLKTLHHNVNFIEESSFKDQLIDIMSKSDEIISFATDDALVTRKIDMNAIRSVLTYENVLTYSSRLGVNINYCYPMKSNQAVPNGQIVNQTFFYDWRQSQLDWAYPMSVDGHFFRKDFILSIIKNLNFKNPNTLESEMANTAFLHQRMNVVACPLVSCYFNSPVNVVQNEFKNRHGNIEASTLNRKFSDGERYDVKKISNFLNQSPHEEVPL